MLLDSVSFGLILVNATSDRRKANGRLVSQQSDGRQYRPAVCPNIQHHSFHSSIPLAPCTLSARCKLRTFTRGWPMVISPLSGSYTDTEKVGMAVR